MTRIRFENYPSTKTPIMAQALNMLNNAIISLEEPTTGEEVWIKKGKNLFNKNDVIVNKTFDENGGIIELTNAFIQLTYIQVSSNKSYTFSAFKNITTIENNRLVICEYDSEKNFIQSNIATNVNTTTIETTANTKYVRLSCVTDALYNLQFEQGSGSTFEDYVYKEIYTLNDDGVYEKIYDEKELNDIVISPSEPISNKKVWLQKPNNLFDKDNIEVSFNYNTDYSVLETGLRAIDTGGTNYQYMAVKLNKSLMGKSITLSSNIIPSANNNGQVAIYYGSSTNPILVSANIYITKTGSITGSLLSEFPNECSELYLILNSNMDGATKVGDYVDYTNLQIYENSIGKNIYVKNDNDEYEKFTDTVSSGASPNGAKVWLEKGKNLFNKNTVVKGHYWNETGALNIGDADASDFIELIVGETYHSNKTISYVYYDENKNFLGMTQNFSGSFTANHPFIKVSCYPQDTESLQIELGNVETTYEPYIDKKIHTKNDNGKYEEFYNETKLQNYSLGEQRIGTWIDGKPLYRKTIKYTTPSTSGYTSVAYVGHCNVKNFYGFCYFNEENICPLPYGEGQFFNAIKYTNGYIHATVNGFENKECELTIEYTKTTD